MNEQQRAERFEALFNELDNTVTTELKELDALGVSQKHQLATLLTAVSVLAGRAIGMCVVRLPTQEEIEAGVVSASEQLVDVATQAATMYVAEIIQTAVH